MQFNFSKDDLYFNLELFDENKEGKANADDIKRVLKEYSNLDET